MQLKIFYDHRVMSYGGKFFELKKSNFSGMDKITETFFSGLVSKRINVYIHDI